MTAEFSVDVDHLDQVVGRLTGLIGFVSDHLDELGARVSTLMQSGEWTGAAAAAYNVTHEEWMTGARELLEGLTQMQQAAKTAHAAYTDAQEMNVRMARG
ncbi:WXG100 family type VII secretion target [Nocardia arizonensis]|uniref:WXG100 family type VII secretion target n=1 Tax=Nocardia arizonensis TaxID=1141647 RepID=UPI0006D18255|nr:WXG100 family type VII secretion target [Nocardia arizonensis]